jgi:Uma2 family endonuclease
MLARNPDALQRTGGDCDDSGRRANAELIPERFQVICGVEGPPTLAIEIFSPSTALADRTRKRALYARHGVPYLWLVDPDARDVEAHVLRAGAHVVEARVSGPQPVDLPPFTGLGLVPSSLWPEPLPLRSGGRSPLAP